MSAKKKREYTRMNINSILAEIRGENTLKFIVFQKNYSRITYNSYAFDKFAVKKL